MFFMSPLTQILIFIVIAMIINAIVRVVYKKYNIKDSDDSGVSFIKNNIDPDDIKQILKNQKEIKQMLSEKVTSSSEETEKKESQHEETKEQD